MYSLLLLEVGVKIKVKKKYNKRVCLDTCIANSLFGYDRDKNGFDQSYNKDLLTKYIIHHGYDISDYNLFEILRKENWYDINVFDNIKKLNWRTHEELKKRHPEFNLEALNLPNKNQRDMFLKDINLQIIDFASDYYARVILFAYFYQVFSILYTSQKEGAYYDQIKIEFVEHDRHGFYGAAALFSVLPRVFKGDDPLFGDVFRERP